MVRFAKRLMLFIPFGHLFIRGRKQKKINLMLLLCLYTGILSCGSPTDYKVLLI